MFSACGSLLVFPAHEKTVLRLIDPTLNDPGFFWSLLGKLPCFSNFRNRLRRFGLQPVTVISLPIDKLNAFRAVRCEVVPESNCEPIEFLETQFRGANGNPDWRIQNSMHCRLYDAYLAAELPDNLEDIDYWKWHVSLDRAGINKRPSDWIRVKIKKALALFNSIKNKGFNDSQLGNLPWVLDRPLISTRYQLTHSVDGYEIYDGHHRVAALHSLGYETMKALLVRDVATQTPFGFPLSEVTRVNPKHFQSS